MVAPERDAPPKISLRDVSRRFGNVTAVEDISLDILDGEFVVLLGPSGCGKSTLLRMIAGLQDVSDGSILIDGSAVTDLEPADRDLAFVFQNYALYPHMSVRGNLSFPLLMKGFRWWHHIPVVSSIVRRVRGGSTQVTEPVDRIAGVLGLEPLISRFPSTLSGGQRQRVALGRAMVREPVAFLMDEPLSNLDAKLRGQMRAELLRFHRLLKTTIVYVTHDQVEAMTMGTHIGVMRDGRLQQYGTPREVYEHPTNTFVAQFVGTPAMSLLPVTLDASGDWLVSGQRLAPLSAAHSRAIAGASGRALIGVRSEWANVAEAGEVSALSGTVIDVEDWGAEMLVTVRLSASHGAGNQPGESLTETDPTVNVRIPHGRAVRLGDEMSVAIATHRLCLFDEETGASLSVAEIDS